MCRNYAFEKVRDDRFEMGQCKPTSAAFRECFLRTGVMNASLNEDGKWLAATDWLNRVIKNGASSTATAFISRTVNGSAVRGVCL